MLLINNIRIIWTPIAFILKDERNEDTACSHNIQHQTIPTKENIYERH